MRWPIISINAFFPDPFDPNIAMTSPECISNETSLSIRPLVTDPVSFDQHEDLLGSNGPLCDTPISSNICGTCSMLARDPVVNYDDQMEQYQVFLIVNER